MAAEIVQPLVEIIFIESASENRIVHRYDYLAQQHFLYFLPEPHGHGSLGLALPPGCGIIGSSKTSGVHFG